MSAVERTSYVAGEWRARAETIEDRNLARSSEVVAEVRAADAALAEDAAAAAAGAFARWRDLPPRARSDILRRAADVRCELGAAGLAVPVPAAVFG
jgi:acyl-CoA reductase-like NAD-dependent aldehyde dehydrogenase